MPKAYFDSIVEAREFAKQKRAEGCWVRRGIESLRVPVNPELFIAGIPTATQNVYAVVYKDKSE